jgi:AraC family transcriptional regulator, dual regulator of chb operon
LSSLDLTLKLCYFDFKYIIRGEAMNSVFLQAATQIDLEKEWGLTYLTSIENCYTELHHHDFYEILLITHGKLINEVNVSEILLEKCSLVFFRPEDLHRLRQYKDEDCQFINLTFLSKTVEELWNYMGEDLKSSKFTFSKFPLNLTLSESQLNKIMEDFNHLNTISCSNKKLSRTTFRMILVDMFFKYLPQLDQKNKQKLHSWIYKLCEDIKKTDISDLRVEELLRLSGRNHSYLCRSFKKYFNITPTEYINQIRLDYAENLLLNSDISIMGICYEAGFENVSHFYKLFSERYQLSPLKYRKKYWNSIHRWT